MKKLIVLAVFLFLAGVIVASWIILPFVLLPDSSFNANANQNSIVSLGVGTAETGGETAETRGRITVFRTYGLAHLTDQVTVMNLEGVSHNNYIWHFSFWERKFLFGDSCWVENGNQVERVGQEGSQALVERKSPRTLGNMCPVGTLFFVHENTFAQWAQEYEKERKKGEARERHLNLQRETVQRILNQQ